MSEKLKQYLSITCFCISLIFGIYTLLIEDYKTIRTEPESIAMVLVESADNCPS